MRLIFAKAKWEASSDPLDTFLSRTTAAGFDATEIHLHSLPEEAAVIREAHAAAGLDLIAQIHTNGETAPEHARSLVKHYEHAVASGALLVNAHTGCDWFRFEENCDLFRLALELEQTHGVPLVHELHRGRALYNAPGALRYAEALPDLRFTADFSHWQVVHESNDLHRQARELETIISRAHHVHARVGFCQGPQIPDPRVPEWAGQLAINTGWWQRILDARRKAGAALVTITPEFGPKPYMPTLPGTDLPVADAWEINCWMRDYLAKELATQA